MKILDYQELFSNKKIYLWKNLVVVLIFIFIIIFIVMFHNHFCDYYEGYASFDSANRFSTLVHVNDLQKILNSKEIVIEGSTFSDSVDSIDDTDFVYEEEIFKRVYVTIDSDKYSTIENNYIVYHIILKRDTILNYVIKSIIGG